MNPKIKLNSFFIFCAISFFYGIYTYTSIHEKNLINANLTASLFLLIIFAGSTLLMFPISKLTHEVRTQRMIVGFSVQFIVMLFFVLSMKLMWSKQFPDFVKLFLVFYFIFLTTQAIFLVLALKRVE